MKKNTDKLKSLINYYQKSDEVFGIKCSWAEPDDFIQFWVKLMENFNMILGMFRALVEDLFPTMVCP